MQKKKIKIGAAKKATKIHEIRLKFWYQTFKKGDDLFWDLICNGGLPRNPIWSCSFVVSICHSLKGIGMMTITKITLGFLSKSQ